MLLKMVEIAIWFGAEPHGASEQLLVTSILYL